MGFLPPEPRVGVGVGRGLGVAVGRGLGVPLESDARGPCEGTSPAVPGRGVTLDDMTGPLVFVPSVGAPDGAFKRKTLDISNTIEMMRRMIATNLGIELLLVLASHSPLNSSSEHVYPAHLF
jgi:hypothetical protein